MGVLTFDVMTLFLLSAGVFITSMDGLDAKTLVGT
jgi:hypothetical protein